MESPFLLCIDDSLHALELRKTSLERFGYSVEVANEGVKALKMLESARFAVVLINYKSEGMDAEAIALHIKQRYPQQRIILLSAYSDLPESLLWLVDDYVMRSDPVEKVVQVIDRLTRPAATMRRIEPTAETGKRGAVA